MVEIAAPCDNRPVASAPSIVRLGLLAVVAVYAFATITVLTAPGDTRSAYASLSVIAMTATLAAGLGLFMAGVLPRKEPWAGLPAVAGAFWLAPVWAGWVDGPFWTRSVAEVATPFLLPVLAHLLLRGPVVVVGYAVTTVVALGRALFRNPFYDPYCWNNCGDDNVFLLHSWPALARMLDTAWAAFAVAFGLLVAVMATVRLGGMTPAGRRARAAVMVPGAAGALSWSVYGGALLARSENPGDPLFMVIFLVQASALTGLALGLTWSVIRAWLRRSAVDRLADDLGAAPPSGALEAALSRVTGDRTLTVAYWLPVSHRHVDSSGKTVDPTPSRTQTATPIVRGGEPVAVVLHDPGGRELEERIGSGARLAIDNERLRAEVLAQVEDLRTSRARIVETGDEARRRLERDLHDGAQQGLLAVTYELRLALAASPSPALEAALDEAQTALRELRELAYGIFPAILHESGLEAALRSLADQAPIPVEIAEVPAVRLPPPVEQALYLIVRNAAETSGEPLRVTVTHDGAMAVLDLQGVHHDLDAPLADRVGALGGEVRHRTGGPQVVIPAITRSS
jgi:signal transduction histidine kinase